MKVSEGEPCGRNVYLYHPDLFKEHEEVIVFTREEFYRNYIFMLEQIDYIMKRQSLLEGGDDWKILGYWPQILEKIHLLDITIDSIFKKESLESYLDAYIYNDIQSSQRNVAVSKQEDIVKLRAYNLDL